MVLPNRPPASDAPPEDSPSSGTPAVAGSPRLLERVRDRIRVNHYSLRTQQAYVDRIKRFIRFHGKRDPLTMGAAEVEALLANLAVERQVPAPTQNQAKAALLVLWGAAVRVMEALRLLVEDVDFVRREIDLRDGKGGKDRGDACSTRVRYPPSSRSSCPCRRQTTMTYTHILGRAGHGLVSPVDQRGIPARWGNTILCCNNELGWSSTASM